MDDDIVRKLRKLGTNGCGIGADGRLLLRAAADEIERLRWMAYQPASDHEPRCDCGQCVPF